jgi:seryl-tRNA synthetase
MNANVRTLNLRPAMDAADEREAEEQANAATEEAASELDEAAGTEEPPSDKNLLRRTRKSLTDKLAQLSQREHVLQEKMAAARMARDNIIAQAKTEFDALETELNVAINQVGTVRRIIDNAVGELTKAEL